MKYSETMMFAVAVLQIYKNGRIITTISCFLNQTKFGIFKIFYLNFQNIEFHFIPHLFPNHKKKVQ